MSYTPILLKRRGKDEYVSVYGYLDVRLCACGDVCVEGKEGMWNHRVRRIRTWVDIHVHKTDTKVNLSGRSETILHLV